MRVIGTHRLTAAMLASFGVLLWGLALSGTPAHAAFTHKYLSDITEVPLASGATVTGPLANPYGLALDGAHLWVSNSGGQPDVDEFATAGGFLSQIAYPSFDSFVWSLALSSTSGEIYVADSGTVVVDVFSAAGVFSAAWKGADSPSGSFGFGFDHVAVDNSKNPSDEDQGWVYVADSFDKVVDAFKPSAGGGETYEGQLTGTTEAAFGEPSGVAVDEATGDVYVTDEATQVVDVFQPGPAGKYTYLRQITGPAEAKFERIGAVAIDPADGTVYVSDYAARVVDQFKPDGTYEGEFSSTPTTGLQQPQGVAVGSEGDVYVADTSASVVDVYGPAVVVPDARTGAASAVTRVTANVAGTMNPDETKAKYFFEYGENGTLDKTTAAAEAEGKAEVPVSTELTALKPATSYSYRLVTENANGKNQGRTKTFTTFEPIENLKTLATTGLSATEATFNGELTPNGFATECWFEYEGGSTPKTKTAKATAGSESEVVKLSQKVAGLEPNTEYRDVFACENSFGTSLSPEASARTLTAPPQVIGESTSNIARQRAVLHAIINPENESTHYFFEYGPTVEYGFRTSEQELTTPSFGERSAQNIASELESNSEYHFRVVAKNSAGIVHGPDSTFTSGSPTPPVVATGGVSLITPSGATVEGLVSTSGLVTSYGFEVSTNSAEFGPPTGLGSVGAGFKEAPATLALGGLQPNTVYHYKLVATNADGGAEGAVHEFRTASYPTDEITVEVLRVLTEPFSPWPVASEPLFLKEAPKGVSPARCKKGHVRRNGKCVAKKAKGKAKGKGKKKKG